MSYERECSNLVWYCVEGSLPLYEIVFFLTNRCNQRCLTCWQWEDDFKSIGKELSDDMWTQLLKDAILMGAKHFYIVGGGEPMVRGDLVMRLAELAKGNNMFCVLHTNGTLFRKEQMDRLIELCWDQIIFSLDGPNPEVNDSIRGKGNFNRAIQNLMYVSQNRIKDENKNLIPDLGINFTITNTNYSYMEDMVQLAFESGCGGIHATLVQPFNKQAEQFVLEDSDIEKCKEALAKALVKAESLGLYHTFNSVQESFEKSKTKQFDLGQKNISKDNLSASSFLGTYCFEPFLSLTISADGKASPCCMFWTDRNPSVQEYSIEKIWNGEFFKEIREQLSTMCIPNVCLNCPSQLRQRSENIRAELKRMGERTTRNPLILVMRFFKRLQNEGFYSAWKRTKEWLYIKMGKV